MVHAPLLTSRLGAALVQPEHRAVIPLMLEPLVQPDGTDKSAGFLQFFGAEHRLNPPPGSKASAADRLLSRIGPQRPYQAFSLPLEVPRSIRSAAQRSPAFSALHAA